MNTVIIEGIEYETGSPAMVAAVDRRTAHRREEGAPVLERWMRRHALCVSGDCTCGWVDPGVEW